MNLTVMKAIGEASPNPRARARLTGLVFFTYVLAAVSSQLFVRGLVIPGDAAATAKNLLSHQPAFRWHCAFALISTAVYIAVTALLYGLLRIVNRNLALMAAFFSLAGCAVQAFGYVFQLAPFVVLGGGPYLSVFKVEQLQALALLFLNLNPSVAYIYLILFGCFNFLIGCLVFRSSFLPRILGVLMALSGISWMIFLSPPLGTRLLPYLKVLAIGEPLLMLWLLVMGVNEQRWLDRAGAVFDAERNAFQARASS